MEQGIWLIAIGVIAGVASLMAGTRGLIAVIVIGIAAAIFAGAQSPNTAMFLAYMLAFGTPIIIVTVAVGAWSGKQIRNGRWGLALLPVALVVFLVWKHYRDEIRLSDEKHRVYDFVESNAQLQSMTGGKVRIFPGSASTYSGSPDYVRYDYTLDAREPLHVILDVYRDTTPVTVRIACVTSASMGQQTANDRCSSGVVPLGDSRFARAAVVATAPASAPEPIPEIPRIAKDTDISVVGTYSARNAPPGNGHEPGDVTVFVAASAKPLLLVLTSYEPVKWNIQNLGRPISAVFTSGYYPSTVAGIDAKVVNIGRDYLPDDRTQSQEVFRTRMRAYSQGAFGAQYESNGVSFTVQPP